VQTETPSRKPKQKTSYVCNCCAIQTLLRLEVASPLAGESEGHAARAAEAAEGLRVPGVWMYNTPSSVLLGGLFASLFRFREGPWALALSVQ
jgi:hypothetical protein